MIKMNKKNENNQIWKKKKLNIINMWTKAKEGDIKTLLNYQKNKNFLVKMSCQKKSDLPHIISSVVRALAEENKLNEIKILYESEWYNLTKHVRYTPGFFPEVNYRLKCNQVAVNGACRKGHKNILLYFIQEEKYKIIDKNVFIAIKNHQEQLMETLLLYVHHSLSSKYITKIFHLSHFVGSLKGFELLLKYENQKAFSKFCQTCIHPIYCVEIFKNLENKFFETKTEKTENKIKPKTLSNADLIIILQLLTFFKRYCIGDGPGFENEKEYKYLQNNPLKLLLWSGKNAQANNISKLLHNLI